MIPCSALSGDLLAEFLPLSFASRVGVLVIYGVLLCLAAVLVYHLIEQPGRSLFRRWTVAAETTVRNRTSAAATVTPGSGRQA